MRVICPHCTRETVIRKTRQLTSQCREVTCHCSNELCGCVFVAEVTPVRILSPSAVPNANVFIPLSTHIDLARIQGDLFKSVPRGLTPEERAKP